MQPESISPWVWAGVGGEVQEGEQDLAYAQHADFPGLRFLDLHDHVGLGKDFSRIGGDPRAGGDVVGIVHADSMGGAGLDDHLLARADQVAHRADRQADAVLFGLNLPGYTH